MAQSTRDGASVVATWERGGVVRYTVLAEPILPDEVSSTDNEPPVTSTSSAPRASFTSSAPRRAATEDWLEPKRRAATEDWLEPKRLKLTSAPGVAPEDHADPPVPGVEVAPAVPLPSPVPGLERPTLDSPRAVFVEFNRIAANGDLSFCWTCPKTQIKARSKLFICPECWKTMDQGKRDQWHDRANFE